MGSWTLHSIPLVPFGPISQVPAGAGSETCRRPTDEGFVSLARIAGAAAVEAEIGPNEFLPADYRIF